MNEAPVENGFFRWVRGTGGQPQRATHWIGGVAAGVGKRFGIDPILARGIMVALCFFGGSRPCRLRPGLGTAARHPTAGSTCRRPAAAAGPAG